MIDQNTQVVSATGAWVLAGDVQVGDKVQTLNTSSKAAGFHAVTAKTTQDVSCVTITFQTLSPTTIGVDTLIYANNAWVKVRDLKVGDNASAEGNLDVAVITAISDPATVSAIEFAVETDSGLLCNNLIVKTA